MIIGPAGFNKAPKKKFKYTDQEARDIIGMTKANAIHEAKHYAEVHDVETIVFFQKWDAERGGNRYDWDEFDSPTCDIIRGDRIVWSSEEGYY